MNIGAVKEQVRIDTFFSLSLFVPLISPLLLSALDCCYRHHSLNAVATVGNAITILVLMGCRLQGLGRRQ